MSDQGELQSLREVSARIGGDGRLVQGAGGNTSLKLGDTLWVKASGRWLSEALDTPIFVPMSRRAVLDRVAAGQADDLGAAVIENEAAAGLKPSIETAIHALMPHAAVLHAHAVNSMATAVLADGETRAATALSGKVRWAWIDYRRPGAPLAAAIETRLGQGGVDVLLLQNHGVVVGGATAAEAEERLRQVERLLKLPVRDLPLPDAHTLAQGESDVFEAIPAYCGLALEPDLINVISTAPLVPDQVVFLGGAAPVCAPGQDVDAAAQAAHARTGIFPAFVIKPGIGVYAARDRSRGSDALLDGLYQIAIRLPAGQAIHGLTQAAVGELLGWDAEHYRRAIDPART